MSWNYRIIKHKRIDGGTYHALHEVYYDASGKPDKYTDSPVTFVAGTNPADIVTALASATNDAGSYPVLDVSEFDK